MIVEARLEGAPVALLFDTGASLTVVERSVLDGLDVRRSGRVVRLRTAGGVVRAPLYTIESFRVGALEFSGLTVAALDLEIAGARGLLGMDVLAGHDFRIDQDAGVLRMRPRLQADR